MSDFRHHPDGIIFIGDFSCSLPQFLELEPNYQLPDGAIGRVYQPGTLHFVQTTDASYPGDLVWDEGDRYIAYAEAYASLLTPPPESDPVEPPAPSEPPPPSEPEPAAPQPNPEAIAAQQQLERDQFIQEYVLTSGESQRNGLSKANPELAESLSEAEFWTGVRLYRRFRLNDSDWSQLPDVGLDEAELSAWRDYRKALRDLPSTYAGKKFTKLVWPEPPQ